MRHFHFEPGSERLPGESVKLQLQKCDLLVLDLQSRQRTSSQPILSLGWGKAQIPAGALRGVGGLPGPEAPARVCCRNFRRVNACQHFQPSTLLHLRCFHFHFLLQASCRSDPTSHRCNTTSHHFAWAKLFVACSVDQTNTSERCEQHAGCVQLTTFCCCPPGPDPNIDQVCSQRLFSSCYQYSAAEVSNARTADRQFKLCPVSQHRPAVSS